MNPPLLELPQPSMYQDWKTWANAVQVAVMQHNEKLKAYVENVETRLADHEARLVVLEP